MNVNDHYWSCAKITETLCGLSAKNVYTHWVHESNNFTNWGATEAHNLAGIKKFRDHPAWFTDDATSPEGDEYQVFENDEQFAIYMAKYYSFYRENGIFEAKDLGEFAQALHDGGYYGDMPGMTTEESIQNYKDCLNERWQEAFGNG